MTEEQHSLLSKIQEVAGLSKTEILLKGLEILSEYYSLGLDKPPLSLELKRLKEEALRYMEALKQIRREEEALKEVVKEIRGVNEVVDKYEGNPSALIQILLDLQAKNHWISKIALLWVSERLRIPLSQIYQVVTFYKAFSLKPRGKHLIRVCLGTACHVRGGPKIMEAVKRHLGISCGETTPDGLFTLERVNCLGCCALGPVMMVDNKYYGNLTPTSAVKVLDKIRKGESEK